MKMRRIHKPINEETIKAFEKKIGTTLPIDYQKFLLNYNGGKPELYIFPETESLYSLALSELYGLNTGKNYSDLSWNFDIFSQRIPNQFIAIGSDISGDQFTLGIKGIFKNKVYLWDHNAELENDEFIDDVLPKNMYELANSFDEFINKLEKDEEA